MRIVACASLAAACLSACGGHYHGHYAAPPPLEYTHYHRLACHHLVECRYYRGGHHFRPHRRHDRYWHVHRTPAGHYKRCYVVSRRHRY